MAINTNFISLFKEGLKVSKNLSKAVKKAAVSAAQAKPAISQQPRIKTRLAICEKCPSLIKSSKRCAECGCFVSAKVQFEFEECPLEKW